jgi:hypothetical protein
VGREAMEGKCVFENTWCVRGLVGRWRTGEGGDLLTSVWVGERTLPSTLAGADACRRLPMHSFPLLIHLLLIL